MFRKFMIALPFASLATSAALGNLLQIVTNGASQQLEVAIGPVPGEVIVTGVNGGGSVSYVGVTAIDLRTGAGQDFVEFRIDTTVIPSITLNTAGGIGDVKFIYELPFTTDAVVSTVTVTGGSNTDTVDFLVNSAGSNFDANWTVNHLAGNNSSTATVNMLEPADSLAIAYTGTSGTGQDTLGLTVVSNAAALDLSVNGTMGGGVDTATVFVDGLGAATTTAALNLDLGAGNDAITAEVISRGGTAALSGSIRGGNDADALTVKLEGDGTVDTVLDAGAGIDLADISIKGNVTGSPRLLGGSGNDELKIVVDGPILATPFIDGGTGYDKAIGFGTIVNVEEIN